VRVGMGATGYSRWFEQLLAELSVEVTVWIGDAAEINVARLDAQQASAQALRILRQSLIGVGSCKTTAIWKARTPIG
jgi:hypothetical protein